MELSRDIKALLQDLRGRLEALYGDRLQAVVLYGSHARGEATPDSDVDVMVVLEGTVDPWAEIRRMSGPALDTEIKYEEMVTLYPVSQVDFEHQELPVLANAHREGILV